MITLYGARKWIQARANIAINDVGAKESVPCHWVLTELGPMYLNSSHLLK